MHDAGGLRVDLGSEVERLLGPSWVVPLPTTLPGAGASTLTYQ